MSSSITYKIKLVDKKSSQKKYLYLNSNQESEKFWEDLINGISEKLGYAAESFIIKDKDDVEIEADSSKFIDWNKEVFFIEEAVSSLPTSVSATTSNASTVIIDEVANFDKENSSSTHEEEAESENVTWSLNDYTEEKRMISDIISKCTIGKSLLEKYQKSKSLNDTNMRHISKLVCNEMLNKYSKNGERISSQTKIEFAKGCVALFPTYAITNSCKGGYENFYNVVISYDRTKLNRRKMSISGFLENGLNSLRRNIHKHNSLKGEDSNYNIAPKRRKLNNSSTSLSCPEEDIGENLSVFKYKPYNSSNAAELNSIFEKLFAYRENLRANNPVSLVQEFPKLLEVDNYILQEFKFMFPEKENKLLQHWDQMRTVIMDVTVERDQWRQHPDIRRFIENYINKGDNDSDAEDYVYPVEEMYILSLLHLLPYLGGNKKRRISVSKAFSELFVYAKTSDAVSNLVLEPERGKQPYILCLGPNRHSIEDYYVVVEQSAIRISGGSFIHSMDFLFKTFFALHIEYEVGVSNLFMFLQLAIYGINGEDFNSCPTGRIHEIKTYFFTKMPFLNKK